MTKHHISAADDDGVIHNKTPREWSKITNKNYNTIIYHHLRNEDGNCLMSARQIVGYEESKRQTLLGVYINARADGGKMHRYPVETWSLLTGKNVDLIIADFELKKEFKSHKSNRQIVGYPDFDCPKLIKIRKRLKEKDNPLLRKPEAMLAIFNSNRLVK